MDTSLIKKLREETGAGMLECKKALEIAQDNYEKALAYLLKNIKNTESNTRVASKGLCHVEIDGNEAILFEVNAETDFVAKNEHFKALIQNLGTVLVRSKVNYAKEALNVKIGDLTVEKLIQQTSGIIKENAYLRRLYRIIKHDEQGFGTYIHQGGKVVSLVILKLKDDNLAKSLAMQVAANNPTYLSLENLDQQTIDYEKMMYEKISNTNDDIMFKNHLKTMVLYEQPYIKNPEKQVKSILVENQNEIIDFFKFELGQGIDHKLNCKLDVPCDGSKITVTPIYA